ncbi:MAG: hypothetical protein HUU09_03080 [Candidatus Jettenia caeni]|uniref:hypothetical protein n=1 Tax=Candidatus Jettenia sp. AMX1 TaxID=2293637 RepID=UPI0018209E23|nr:hypothetical protein [Candidatus Jettenia sp. AMX1]MDL1940000.1 hypothetical protein [Candidatus Jettenia sp. AMX1]NUN22432.1 hypothetical protein [Candidatus Jettenia caeni]GIL18947.1 MAG: hypothetical protein BroJett041_00610 [Candidatus Jettenia caeni]GJQ46224.1 MAG: hypothetical protein JETCAE04_19780 [Candidatus Jettenia caeni]
MKMPEFIAEVSLYKMNGNYQSIADLSYNTSEQSVTPARPINLPPLCCVCEGDGGCKCKWC